jgi:hypothetical protein
MKRIALHIAASIAAFVLVAVPPALAQVEAGPEGGVSAYAVARVKVLDGSVWVRPSDGGDWEEFSSNSPIPPNSRVSVPDGSEAELQFHGGQFVLLTSGTDLEVRDLQEGNSVFRLRAGEIRFDLPPDDFAPVSVRVPGGAPSVAFHKYGVAPRGSMRRIRQGVATEAYWASTVRERVLRRGGCRGTRMQPYL